MNAFPRRRHKAGAFTLLEILVVVTVLLILMAIAVPAYLSIIRNGHQNTALNNLRQVTAAYSMFVGQNDGALPREDGVGVDTWETAAKPENADVWYNALPKLLGGRGVGQYSSTPREFYTGSNILFLPGAKYPEGDARLRMPMFAIAINTKLQRKDLSGVKEHTRLANIGSPSRTVVFLEQGLPNEKKAMPQQPAYDGSCKGSAKSFVTRYNGKGILSFLDGHAEAVAGEDILSPTGEIPYPPKNIIWTKDPADNPNKAPVAP